MNVLHDVVMAGLRMWMRQEASLIYLLGEKCVGVG